MRTALVFLVAVVLTGAAAAAIPATRHTTAGTATAQNSLLTLADLGKGWTTSTKAGTVGLQLQCTGYQPSGSGIVETGSASSPDFSGSASGPFIVQQTSVYASAQQASTWWSRGVQPGLIKCIAQTLETVARKGIKVTISSQGALPITKVTPMTAAYRVAATLHSKTQDVKTYFDVVLVGKGMTLTEITFSTFVAPPPAAVEHALALNIARRIGIPTA